MKKIKLVHLLSLNINIQRFAEILCVFLVTTMSFNSMGQNNNCSQGTQVCSNYSAGYQVNGYAQISSEVFAAPAQITLTAGGTQTVFINTPITTTTYSVTGATVVTVAGLPDGVIFSWASNIITLSGVPIQSGIFNYVVSVLGACGPVTTDGTIEVLAGAGYVISGKTSYAGKANAGITPNPPTYNPSVYNIDNVIVVLKNYPSGTEITRDTSDASGNYQIEDVSPGNYVLYYDKFTADSMQLGNGIDAIDVSLLKYFIGADSVADPSRCFSSKYKKAGNVDNTLTINAVDVSRVKAKVGSPYNIGRNFPKGNWVALDTLIIVSGSNLDVNLKTICYGDYNASSTKYRDSAANWDATKSVSENMIVVSDNYLSTCDPSYIEIPLSISEKLNDFSALGLELTYPDGNYTLVKAMMGNPEYKNQSVKINPSLDEIIAEDNDLLVTDENGVIRVVFATTQHFDVNANDEIIRLGFRPVHGLSQGQIDFNLVGTGVIGNQYGEANTDAFLIMPKIFIQDNAGAAGFEFTAYPNPFSSDATLTYNLTENGIVRLNVYNAIGELLKELVNESQTTGKHSVMFASQGLPAGLYTFKLDFQGKENSRVAVIKMIK